MDLQQLRCFVHAAEELHFGRAAQKMDMLPSAFGRFIRLLEEDLGVALFVRTTRNIALTDEGRQLLADARLLVTQADAIRARFSDTVRARSARLRVGAIDSAALGLLPLLLADFAKQRPDAEVELFEDKTVRLLPRLMSGRLDLAFVRPPTTRPQALEFRHLFYETPIVAMPSNHPLARRKKLSIADLAAEPLIVPDRRSRPHSHDLTIKLFEQAGLVARIKQVADEKQTIVNLVAANLGSAIVPRWMSRMKMRGVSYVGVSLPESMTSGLLPLAAAWMRDARDPLRDSLVDALMRNIERYAARA